MKLPRRIKNCDRKCSKGWGGAYFTAKDAAKGNILKFENEKVSMLV
jgi:hypothetical protein